MFQPLRHVLRRSASTPSPETWWRVALVLVGLAVFIVLRGCGYDAAVPASYLGYLLTHVMLPGIVAVGFFEPRRVGLGRLLALGVPAGRIALSHTDKVADVGLHRETLATGVNVVYDQGLRQGADAIGGTARLVADAFATGRGDQVLLGTDAARRTLWSVHGGPLGIAWIVTGFLDLLRAAGLTEADIDRVFVVNPARLLAFTPPA